MSFWRKRSFTVIDDAKNARREKAALIVGLWALGLLVVLFGFKYFMGYYEVEYAGTFDNCSVEAYEHIGEARSDRLGQGRLSNTHYYVVEITCPEPELHYKIMVEKSYYKKFQRYSSSKVTFYKAKCEHNYLGSLASIREDGWEWFPTYKLDCDEREAEREFRSIYPPTNWQIVYVVLLLIAILGTGYGIRSKIPDDIVLFGNSKDEC